MTKIQEHLPIQACGAFEVRYAGYFTPNGTNDPAVVCHGKGAVEATHEGTGEWDLVLTDPVAKIIHAKAWPIDDGSDIVEVQVLEVDDATKTVTVRCRRAADLAGTLAVSNSCDRIAFEIVALTENLPADGV